MKNYYPKIILLTALLLVSFCTSLFSADNTKTSRSASISATAQVISPIGIVTVSDEESGIARHGNRVQNVLTHHRQSFRSTILFSGSQTSNLLMTVEIDGRPVQLEPDLIKSVDRLTMHDQSVGRSVYSLEHLGEFLPAKGSEYLITLITTDN